MPMAAAERDYEHVFLDHIRRGKRSNRITAYVMLGVAVLPWLGYLAADFKLIGAIVLTVICIGIAAAFFALSLGDPAQHPVLKTLREQPGDIVWAYVSTQTQYGNPVSSTLNLGLASGKLVSVNAEVNRERELMEVIARLAPQATLGFDPQRAATFRQNPSSLRRQA
jgi:hypothetical protein